MIQCAAAIVQGRMFAGRDYAEIFEYIARKDLPFFPAEGRIKGFLTATGRFLDRKAALEHALMCGQLRSTQREMLCSADIQHTPQYTGCAPSMVEIDGLINYTPELPEHDETPGCVDEPAHSDAPDEGTWEHDIYMAPRIIEAVTNAKRWQKRDGRCRVRSFQKQGGWTSWVWLTAENISSYEWDMIHGCYEVCSVRGCFLSAMLDEFIKERSD